MDSSNPAGAFWVAVGHLPVGVKHPLSLKYFQQTPGIRGGVFALHGQFGEEASCRGDGWNQDVFHKLTEVPVEEGTVQNQGRSGFRRTLAEVIGSD